jgi:hypothetical protein
MPRSAVNIAQDYSTDATYRTFIQAIETEILALGWQRSSDTGQMNTATVLTPTASFQTRGYIIWEATDTLAGSYPMRFKWVFASGSSATVPNYTFVFGSTTDGAGTFTGTNWSINPIGSSLAASATTYRCLFSGDTNRLAFVMFDDHPTGTKSIVGGMERAHDAVGADSSAGWYAFNASGTAGTANQFVPYVSTGSGVQTEMQGPSTTGSSAVIGTSIGLYPNYPIYGTALNLSTQLLTYMSSDITVATIFALTFYGATMNFVATQNSVGNNNRGRIALRWDT